MNKTQMLSSRNLDITQSADRIESVVILPLAFGARKRLQWLSSQHFRDSHMTHSSSSLFSTSAVHLGHLAMVFVNNIFQDPFRYFPQSFVSFRNCLDNSVSFNANDFRYKAGEEQALNQTTQWFPLSVSLFSIAISTSLIKQLLFWPWRTIYLFIYLFN